MRESYKECRSSMKSLLSMSHWLRWGLTVSYGLLFLLGLIGSTSVWAQSAQVRTTSGTTSGPYGLADVVTESIFGQSNPANFTPLSLSYFGDGWLEPWIDPGTGSSGALRGGWVSTFSGFFSREIDPTYSFTSAESPGRDEHVGSLALLTPLSRRVEMSLSIPFVDSLQSGGGKPSETSFGDIVLTPKVMLHETRDLSVSTGVGLRTPSGAERTGNGRTAVSPFLAFWQGLDDRWQVRGGIGADVLTQKHSTPDAVLRANLAVGTTLSSQGAAPLGNFTPYVSLNLYQNVGSGPDTTTFSVTPGIRTYLGWTTYFISGVEIPVTNPDPFEWRVTAVLSKGF